MSADRAEGPDRDVPTSHQSCPLSKDGYSLYSETHHVSTRAAYTSAFEFVARRAGKFVRKFE